jgi:Flp pilus assembly protein TadD
MQALLLQLAGRADEAQPILDQLARETAADRAWTRAGDPGVCAARRGDRAQALRISDELSRLEPSLETPRGYPPFEQLMKPQ